MKRLVVFCFLFAHAALAQTVIVTELADLPSSVSETSGLENGPDNCFWTHNDSGNGEFLYCIDSTGVTQRTVTVVGDENDDWEELAKDDEGNLYIGNFGNNGLARTDLRIVKIPSIDTCTGTTFVTETISFSYPDQLSFPPSGDYGNFDMEAMFWHQDSLHLFSKDRSDPSTGHTKHYTLPTDGGNYVANLVDSFQANHPSFFLAVTAADINETETEVVLLSADKVWLFSNFSGTDYFGGDAAELNLSVFSQKEGVCYRNGFLYITDEESFGLGGKIYRVDTRLFVAVNNEREHEPISVIYNQDFTLERILLSPNSLSTWNLFTTDGRFVQSGKSEGQITAGQLTVDSGVYILQIFVDGEKSSSTIIKK